MSPRPGRAVAALVALGLAASACSGADSGVTSESAAPAPGAAAGGGVDATTTPGSATATDAPTTSGAAPVTTVPTVADELDWSTCDVEVDPTGSTECATLRVPVDYDDPDATLIDIAVARIDTADDDEQIGSLVMNPGGPGGSGIEFLIQASATVPAEVQERFDLVSFDPRGVGLSAPIQCQIEFDDEIELLAPGDDAAWAGLVDDAEGLLDRCDRPSQQLFTFVGTNNAARDLERLRAALGDEGLTYVGYSYGSRLGATYAELFPERVRALVLDGAVTPSVDAQASAVSDAAGFDRALSNFAAACDDDEDCALRDIGPAIEVIASLEGELTDAGSLPTEDADRSLTPGELQLAVYASLYSQDYWPILAGGLAQAVESQDGTLLQALADSYLGRSWDGTYSNLFSANIAINCADQAERPSADEQRAVGDAAAAASEYFPDFLRASTGCLGAPPAQDPIVIGPAVGAPPILVIGTTGDPATPYESAVELAEFLDSGVLYTVEGEGHTAYGSIDCVADAVNAYLVELEVPDPDDASCADDADADVFLPPGESEVEQVVALLACLRDNGVDLPEIGIDELLLDPFGETFTGALDPNDPGFADAALACQDLFSF